MDDPDQTDSRAARGRGETRDGAAASPPAGDLRQLLARSRLALLPLLIALVVGPAIGFRLYRSAADRDHSQILSHFDAFVSDQAFALQSQLVGLCEVLHAIRAFHECSETVSHGEFTDFAASMRVWHPTIRTIGWIARVPAGRRAEHEAAMRRSGTPDFRITELDGSGRPVPARERDEYYPVCFVEPANGNEQIVGLDLGSEALQRATLDRAAGTGDVVLTAPLCRGPDPAAVLAIIAVPAGPENGAKEGGFAVVRVNARDLVWHALRGPPPDAPLPMEHRLEDPTDGAPALLLHQSADAPAGEPWPVTKRIPAPGRTWLLHARPTSAFLSRYRSLYPAGLGIAVAVGWNLLFGFLFLQLRRSHVLSLRRVARIVQSVFGRMSEGVVIADREGRHMFFNDAARRIVGRQELKIPPAEWPAAYGCYLPDRVTPCPAERLPLVRAMRGETTTNELLFLRHEGLPDGAWLSVSGAPLVDPTGRLAGGVVVMRDITSRRKAEESLDRLSNAVEQTADVVFITDRDGRIEYANPAFETVFGFTRAEALGQTPRILKSGCHDDGFYRHLWQTVLAGKVYRSAAVNRRKDGQLVHTEQTITPILDPRGEVTHFVSVLRDMTEARRLREHEAELRLAAIVQRGLYPTRAPKIAGLDVAGSVLPANATSGDYYDLVRMGDGSLILAVGDVSGHGLGPALLMAETRAFLRSLVHVYPEPSAVLGRLNHSLAGDMEPGRFVTLLVARIDVSRRQMVYGNAGHLPGLILDRSGEVRETLGVTGPALGLSPDSEYGSPPPIALRPEDIVVLLTDGVTETRAPDGATFGEHGPLSVVRRHRHETARSIVGRVNEAVLDFAQGEPHLDDCTLVVCKVTPAAPERPA